MMNYQFHPLCTLFPNLNEHDAESLAADIRVNGLRDPITLHDGMILDGGNRYLACLAAGVAPTFVEFDGGNLVDFVLSVNLHRRHMSQGQQAAIVASAQDWSAAQPARKPYPAAAAGLAKVADRSAQSGASDRTQRMADAVAKKNPDLAKKVAIGEVSLIKAAESVGLTKPRTAAKPEPAPKAASPTKTPPEPISELEQDELSDANERIEILSADLESALADNNAMGLVFDADDRLAAAMAEIKRLSALLSVIESRNAGLMNECNQAKKAAKTWMNKFNRLERKNKADFNNVDFEGIE